MTPAWPIGTKPVGTDGEFRRVPLERHASPVDVRDSTVISRSSKEDSAIEPYAGISRAHLMDGIRAPGSAGGSETRLYGIGCLPERTTHQCWVSRCALLSRCKACYPR